MEYLPDKLSYRCNACGHKYAEAFYCEHCKSPMCPECKRTGCIVNVVEMQRMVSHSIITKSQMKKKTNGKPKKIKDPAERIKRLMELTQ